MKVCGTKPPPKLSSANSADSRMTIPRERWSGGSGSASSSSPRSTAGVSAEAATRPAAAASGAATTQPAADPVAVAGDQHRDKGGACEQGGEDGADSGGREAAAGERDADQHRAEPVGERPGGLGGEDPARVGAQARSS